MVVGDQGSYMAASYKYEYFGEPREKFPEGISECQALPGVDLR